MSNKKNFVIDGNIIGFGIESDYNHNIIIQNKNKEEEYQDYQDYEGNDNNEDNNYYEEEGDDDNDNDNDNNVEYNLKDEDEVPPMMPTQFYSDVDMFLNRPPPKIKGVSNNKSKTRGKLEENIIKSTSLPIILPPQKPKKIESKINTGRKGPGKKIDRHIDQSLLQQAFEYTEKLQREAVESNLNDIRETIPKKKSNSAPHNLSAHQRNMNSQEYYNENHNYNDNEDDDNYDGEEQNEVHSLDCYQQKIKSKNIKSNGNSNSHGHNKVKGKKGSNLVKRLRSQTYTHQDQSGDQQSSSFDTSLKVGDGGSQRQQVSYEDLIANFEQGITLKLLKKELEESKISLERSNKAVEQISKEMSAKMRF